MKRTNLYTIFLEYKGGTYISQILDCSVEGALKQWADSINLETINSWGLSRDEVVQLCEDNPVLLKGCMNVWCVTATAKKGLMLVNIIMTSQEA